MGLQPCCGTLEYLFVTKINGDHVPTPAHPFEAFVCAAEPPEGALGHGSRDAIVVG